MMTQMTDGQLRRGSRFMLRYHYPILALSISLALISPAPAQQNDNLRSFLDSGAMVALAQGEGPEAAEVPGQSDPDDANIPLPIERILWHVPDPEVDRAQAAELLQEARDQGDTARARYISRVLELVEPVHRKRTTELSLEEAIQRALATSYVLRVDEINPAIETTRLVEAQAAFDAVFFSNINQSKIDRPSGSQLTATSAEVFTSSTGIRKLLPTGLQVSGRVELNRTKTSLVFQGINPEYTSNFVFELRQPILRGFGLDFNRSFIVLARNNQRISTWAFQRTVRDVVRQVEEAYWRLAQARRDVVVSARLLVEFEQILEYLDARRDFDVIPVQLAATEADLEATRAEFVRRIANVFDAEDQLIALMNSDDVDLADDVEIITVDFPQVARVTIDRLAEVQTALTHRQEIREQKLQVENARIGVGRAKNQELPRLDFSFRQMIDGLGQSADAAFDQATTGRFIEYFFGIELEVPIGNRGPRAARMRAELQYDQAVALLRQRIEEVVFDVNVAARQLETTYDQIEPVLRSADARLREIESIVARAERKDFNTLINELNSRRTLANTRRALLNAIVEYAIAIVDLERAKGTLLSYNNIVIPSDE